MKDDYLERLKDLYRLEKQHLSTQQTRLHALVKETETVSSLVETSQSILYNIECKIKEEEQWRN